MLLSKMFLKKLKRRRKRKRRIKGMMK